MTKQYSHCVGYADAKRAAWAVAQRMTKEGQPFGYGEIAVALKIRHDRATSILRGWAKAGALVVVREGGGSMRKLWSVDPAYVPPPAPRHRAAEDNMWLALRSHGSVSPVELAALADTGVTRVTVEEARAYCQVLVKAGYLRVARKADPARGVEAIYRLLKNTGPFAPRARRVQMLHDPNIGTNVEIGGVA